jgi:hypothetical protein
MGITPIFVFVGDEDKVIDRGKYIIRKIKKVNNHDEGFQSQICRLFIPKHYPNETLITSDIDMFPIDKDYFTKTTTPYNENSLVIFTSNAYENDGSTLNNKNKYPICYNAAMGKTFSEILDLNCNFEEFCDRLWQNHPKWDSDETYLAQVVNRFHDQKRIIKLRREFYNSYAEGRIDRGNWSYTQFDFRHKEYKDSHCLRPYKRYRKEINELIKNIYNHE